MCRPSQVGPTGPTPVGAGSPTVGGVICLLLAPGPDHGSPEHGFLTMPYIGIDFGTSNSVVANFQYGQAEVVPNHEGQKWTPSVVTLRRDGTLAFGQEAKENFDEQRSIRSIKRILGSSERVPLIGQNLRPEPIAVMLFSLLTKDAGQGLNETLTT